MVLHSNSPSTQTSMFLPDSPFPMPHVRLPTWRGRRKSLGNELSWCRETGRKRKKEEKRKQERRKDPGWPYILPSLTPNWTWVKGAQWRLPFKSAAPTSLETCKCPREVLSGSWGQHTTVPMVQEQKWKWLGLLSRWMDGASTPDSAQPSLQNPSRARMGHMRVWGKVVEQERPGSGQKLEDRRLTTSGDCP